MLEIVAIDKGIKQNMPAWCKATSDEYLALEDQGEEI
jgi:TusA-related sulfurtransferase